MHGIEEICEANSRHGPPVIQAEEWELYRYGLQGIWFRHPPSGSAIPVLPDAHCDLILCYDRESGEMQDLWITGFETRTRIVENDAGVGFVGIQFHPGALPRLPVAEIGNRSISLSSVDGKMAQTLMRSFEESRREKSVRSLHRWVQDYAGEVKHDLLAATLPLRRTPAETRPADWARSSGISLRTLERHFLQCTGLTPGAIAGILRFQRACRLAKEADTGLAELAFLAGYSDQAHMSREVKKFTNQTPSSFFSNRVVFVQDPAGRDVLDSFE